MDMLVSLNPCRKAWWSKLFKTPVADPRWPVLVLVRIAQVDWGCTLLQYVPVRTNPTNVRHFSSPSSSLFTSTQGGQNDQLMLVNRLGNSIMFFYIITLMILTDVKFIWISMIFPKSQVWLNLASILKRSNNEPFRNSNSGNRGKQHMLLSTSNMPQLNTTWSKVGLTRWHFSPCDWCPSIVGAEHCPSKPLDPDARAITTAGSTELNVNEQYSAVLGVGKWRAFWCPSQTSRIIIRI